MSEEIRMIALRIKGMRELAEYTPEDISRLTHVPVETYLNYEQGETDIPVSFLYELANLYHVDLTVLLTGEDARMHSFFVVRKDKGFSVDRRKEYTYQSLAYGLSNKLMEPFMVSVDPSEGLHQYSHPGQEFVHVMDGVLRIALGKHVVDLNPGDSVYFDSSILHGMQALGDTPARFLSVISQR
jgi:quercetin dioxygenase-like cupin family protein